MIVLGIDPGSVTSGWAILKSSGNKIEYIDSGILKFNSKKAFLDRTTEIKLKIEALIRDIEIDCVALESLIYVKSPTALIKLAQTRGIFLSAICTKFEGKIFEYSPNLIKSTVSGHGHADKESMQKFLSMLIGDRDYQTHDESDAVAVALCHIMNYGNKQVNKPAAIKKSRSKGLAASLSHKF